VGGAGAGLGVPGGKAAAATRNEKKAVVNSFFKREVHRKRSCPGLVP